MTTSSLGAVPGTFRISVAAGVEYGVMHNNPFDNANLPFPFPDALQEVKLEASSLTAGESHRPRQKAFRSTRHAQ